MSRPALRILHIEDSFSDAELVRLALEEGATPVELHHAADGAEALRILRLEPPHQDRPRPDMVLLDLNMPGVSGHETLAAIKGDPELRSIPVLVLTTSAAPQDVTLAYDAHANSYLRKPISFVGLVELMGRVEQFWLEAAHLPRA